MDLTLDQKMYNQLTTMLIEMSIEEYDSVEILDALSKECERMLRMSDRELETHYASYEDCYKEWHDLMNK